MIMEINQKHQDLKSASGSLISLTDSAITKIKSMMAKEGKEGFGLRMGVVTGGCAGLSYDLPFQQNP